MNEQFVLVSTARQRRLVRVSDIQEIVALMALAEVHERRGVCRGMANLRGEIVPIFDLSGPHAPLSPSRFILVCRVAEHPIGLIVDEVHDVITLERASIVERPVGDGRSLAVALVGDDLLTILEPGDALHVGG
jgi:chemotaxis signal transduction protein